MGWSSFWRNVERTWRDISDWYGDTTDEGYSWFGIRSQDGQVQIVKAPRAPRYSSWEDATNPNLFGEHFAKQSFFPNKSGYTIQLGAEFLGSPGTPPQGIKFVGHAPESVLNTLTMSMSNAALVDDDEQRAGFSARLVQRDFDGRPRFVSGSATSVSNDGVVYREDLRLPAKSPFRVETSIGGPIERLLPMFITLTPYGDIGSVTGIDALQIQVTANLLVEEVI